ncbi:CapA family protein [Sediminispirochaeta smaragdinae]|uniref:Capsule synthesis protein, CapA n=1 Tax=Sediminispirochaeta smaragdinae (strain DSM 11293 / JCM 15392 / SEBR 4228) TaxID=573413 RepID=E1R772_SEDSS|nr:CapA family protein [Sediminispirochaeta smaragdinae]ADK81399.1 Capsule synthesis protein, CapA [Sediminispirochaeta smaragdinae DSM 11293]
MKNGHRLFSLMILVTSLSSCTLPPSSIVAEGPSLTDEKIEELLSSAPFAITTSDSENVPLTKLSFRYVEPFQELPPDSLIIRREELAFTTELHDSRFSLTRKEAKEATASKSDDLIQSTDLRLPRRALSIDGSYLGDPGYPLIRYLVLLVHPLSETKPESFFQKVSFLITKGKRDERLRAHRKAVESWVKKIAASQPSAAEKTIWIDSVGDMIFSRGVEPLLSQSGGLYKVFDTTLPILQSAHLSAGNFEGTLASANRKAEPKSYNFRFSPKVLPYLEKAGFDYLSITNNHIWDFGKEGFLDTLKAIESSHLATSGAGRNFKAAAVPWKTELEHQEISILSVGAYPQERNGFNGKDIAFAGNDKPGILFVDRGAREAIKEAFDDDAFHVLYVHGGWEWHRKPDAYYRELYRSFVDLGADLVVASHPHVLQGMEAYHGALIAYSLGNFIFPGMEEMKWATDSMILRVGIREGKICYVEPIPAVLSGKGVKKDPDEAKALQRFIELHVEE